MSKIQPDGDREQAIYELGKYDERQQLIATLKSQICFNFNEGDCPHGACYNFNDLINKLKTK